jgi:hypothetical protein
MARTREDLVAHLATRLDGNTRMSVPVEGASLLADLGGMHDIYTNIIEAVRVPAVIRLGPDAQDQTAVEIIDDILAVYEEESARIAAIIESPDRDLDAKTQLGGRIMVQCMRDLIADLKDYAAAEPSAAPGM